MHTDLLSLAKRIAKFDPKRPKQANLRKAISAAYYALFQFLVDQSCRQAMGTTHATTIMRQVLARSFTHFGISLACKAFSAGSRLTHPATRALRTTFSIPAEVQQIALTFVSLQERRHTANYDFTQRFSRSEVLGVIREVEIAINQFGQLKSSDEKSFLLACLWAWKTIGSR